MLAYTMVGTQDLERALQFYTPRFNAMGLDICWQDDSCVSFGDPDDVEVPQFFRGLPFDGHPATVGNGTMTAFQFSDIKEVDTLHQLALQSGGSDEGEPVFASVRRWLLRGLRPRPRRQQARLRGVSTPGWALSSQFSAQQLARASLRRALVCLGSHRQSLAGVSI
ncbi:VOC family protein [Sphingopyxis terrae]|uniref:hypothetical protein n=1 Tax=Sphingopyxis terrae TaxID=33052 RepID=UPI00363C1F27